jgi:predicted transport protein
MENQAMADKMIANLQEKTGKSLEEWIAIVKNEKIEKHKAIIDFLKTEHGFTYGFANLVAHKSQATDAGSVENTDDLITEQYSKGKEALRPLYDKLISAINAFGADVDVAPKRAYVSIRRKKQFAIIQPSTKTRLDIGINLKDHPTTDRLEASGSFNGMVSHRVRTSELGDINNELIAWIKTAYENAG